MTSSPSQRGFTMALALAVAVVIGLLLMRTAPDVKAEVQRENESELIFRGEAIATAIKLYATKAGHYPTNLEEIMKLRPRILRQEYKDPMTASGDWEYVTQVRPGASGNTDGLPIVGVRSRSTLNSIHVYQNKTLIRDWLFTADQNLLGITDGVDKAPKVPKTGAVVPAAPAEAK